MRMKTFLRKKQQSGDYNPRTWVWIKDRWKPVKNHRFVKRGKRKGWVEVELYWPEGKVVTVLVTSMKFANATTGQETS
jgi:hypothetical protein